MTLLWLTFAPCAVLWSLLYTVIFISSHLSRTPGLSRVTCSLSRGCSQLRCLAPTEVVSGQVRQHPTVTRHLPVPPPHPPSRSRLLFSRNSLITRAPGSDSPVSPVSQSPHSHHRSSVLPDNSKYVPIWWCVVRQSINNSFPHGHEYHKCTGLVIREW